MKKIATHKSVKAHSKTKLTQHDQGFELHQQPISNQIACQISRLQQMIIAQTQRRQSSQKQLLSKIKHLEVTKKSKLPSKPEISNFSKLLSPAKQPKKFEHDQSISECKNLLTNIKSERQFEINSFRLKLVEIQKQIRQINKKVDYDLSEFAQKISWFCKNQKQIEAEAAKNFLSLDQQNSNLQKQLNLKVQKISESIITTNFFLTETINKKEEQKFSMLQRCIKTCLQTLSRVQNQANYSFQALDQKMRMARQSIIETKETIEQTIFGSEYRSREKLESLSSIEGSSQVTSVLPKRTNETTEKLSYIERRVQGLERRMDLIYAQYLSRPFHRA